tara:strand:- start:13831 stop:13980 length:150 start_codon:yes stop_codon:yes gene_type:complete
MLSSVNTSGKGNLKETGIQNLGNEISLSQTYGKVFRLGQMQAVNRGVVV